MVVVDPVVVCPHPEPEGCVCPFVADPFGGPSEVPGFFVVPGGEYAPLVGVCAGVDGCVSATFG